MPVLIGGLVAFVLLTSAPASADPIRFHMSTTLSLTSGPDTAGLDGAQVDFTAVFADGAVYDVQSAGFPAVDPQRHVYRIQGSAGGAHDGVFSSASGLTFFPTFDDQGWFGGGGGVPRLLLPAVTLVADLRYQPPGSGSEFGIGQPVKVSHFALMPGSSFGPDFLLWEGSDGSLYDWASASTSQVGFAVPEGSAPGMVLLGLLAAWRARASLAGVR